MKQSWRKESVKGDEETERNAQEQKRRRKKECVWNKSDDSGKVMSPSMISSSLDYQGLRREQALQGYNLKTVA
jgi:hypothetical protein